MRNWPVQTLWRSNENFFMLYYKTVYRLEVWDCAEGVPKYSNPRHLGIFFYFSETTFLRGDQSGWIKLSLKVLRQLFSNRSRQNLV